MTDAWTRPGSQLRHVRPAPLFLALVLVFVISGVTAWRGDGEQRMAVFLFVMTGWLISLCLHEFSHAFTALRAGDTSVIGKGYLTLDPIKYSDPLFTFIIPAVFVLMGGIPLSGGAVYIERGRIRGRVQNSLVSAAGPLTNVALAAVCITVINSGALDNASAAFHAAFVFFTQLQIIASILNLLPVPGLDGFGIIEPWLSYDFRRAIAPYAPFAPLLLFGLLFTPEINNWFFDRVDSVCEAFNVSPAWASLGYHLFQFWK
ncbi:site-2 protease family protein [Yinghuangia seranimata]|uniref:site-2 protease family protein n=1 Tax=Yinghuangia seranimata TaxID=408067 RepID=UPI00248B9444|nr:site-2 protease family protein [Yinghuangia seranimata]MDI2132384.1 site-2 protease family protein [Yinghuangia seranimata]